MQLVTLTTDFGLQGIYRLLMSDYHLPVNIGNPQEITIQAVAEEVIRIAGSASKVVYKPLPVDDPKVRQPDITLARKLLGWDPQVSRAEGLQKTYEYFYKILKP